jgi:hypothetical protein
VAAAFFAGVAAGVVFVAAAFVAAAFVADAFFSGAFVAAAFFAGTFFAGAFVAAAFFAAFLVVLFFAVLGAGALFFADAFVAPSADRVRPITRLAAAAAVPARDLRVVPAISEGLQHPSGVAGTTRWQGG